MNEISKIILCLSLYILLNVILFSTICAQPGLPGDPAQGPLALPALMFWLICTGAWLYLRNKFRANK